MEIILIEPSGMEQSFPMDKGVIRIGSAPTCDVRLSDRGSASLHLQVFYSVQQPDRCKVLNVGPEVWAKRQGVRQKLPSAARVEMAAGDEILIDNTKLIFGLPASSGVLRASSSIGATLSFPHAVLYSGIPNVGTLTIRNTGKNASCQFQVRVHGLPGDCFKIDPAPILHPNAEEQFMVYLFHRGTYPKAGFHELKFIVSAAHTYPGEEVMIRQQVYVAPLFDAVVELQDDFPAEVIDTKKELDTSFSPEALETPDALVGDVNPKQVKEIRKIEQGMSEDYWTDGDSK